MYHDLVLPQGLDTLWSLTEHWIKIVSRCFAELYDLKLIRVAVMQQDTDQKLRSKRTQEWMKKMVWLFVWVLMNPVMLWLDMKRNMVLFRFFSSLCQSYEQLHEMFSVGCCDYERIYKLLNSRVHLKREEFFISCTINGYSIKTWQVSAWNDIVSASHYEADESDFRNLISELSSWRS